MNKLNSPNANPYPVKIYPNEGIAQLLLFQTGTPVEVGYGNGKYQSKENIKVKN